MKVKCIDSVWSRWNNTYRCVIYSGKEYDVLKVSEDGYIIRNEVGILDDYPKGAFEEVEEMEKEKVLEVEFQDVFDEVAWRIVYKNEDIINMWKSKGKDNEEDFKWIFTLELFSNFGIHVSTKEEAESIKQKVDVINDKYGIPKKWRAEYNGKYFVIGNDGVIFEDIDKGYDMDNRRYVLGNYFKTKEEAQAKLDKIKQIFSE